MDWESCFRLKKSDIFPFLQNADYLRIHILGPDSYSFTTIYLSLTLNLEACRRTRSGFERPFFRLAASGCVDDKTNIACFAVFARRKMARSRADDGIIRQTPRANLVMTVNTLANSEWMTGKDHIRT